MKINLILVSFALLTGNILAAETPYAPLTAAVYDFKDEAEAGGYGSKVTALVTAELATNPKLVMLERGELKRALNEQALGLSGMVNSDAAARIGQITGAKILVSGQVITLEQNHLVIVADIIGTETARLFAATVEGPKDKLEELAADLSSKIAQTIIDHATNLIGAARESAAARLERIAKSVTGTNRPTILVGFYHPAGPHTYSATANTEMGIILQKAGFTVVDGNSERKPDLEITGMVDVDGYTRNGMHTEHAVVEVKVQERRTGFIIAMDREESVAVDSTQVGAQRSAQALAVDKLAERFLPSLAK